MPTLTYTERKREISLDEQGYYRGTRQYLVVTDDPAATTVATVEDQAPIALYDPFPDREIMIARTFTASTGDDSQNYTLTVQYSSAPMRGSSGDVAQGADERSPSSSNNGQQSADLRLPSFTLDETNSSVPRTVDRSGEPVINTAGDPIEGIETPESSDVMTIEYTSWNLTNAHRRRFINKVNAATYKGYPAETLRCRSFKAVETFENFGGVFLLMKKCTVILEEKVDGWNPTRVMNAGKRQRIGGSLVDGVPTGGKIQGCIDSAGQPVSDSVPLDAVGAQLTGGDPDSIVYKYFNFYETDDFTQLLL